MATAPHVHTDVPSNTDDFEALEERVLRMVELLRTERRERQKAEETAAALQQLLDEQGGHLERANDELRTLGRERDQVRGRVERLLRQMDELG